MAGNYDKQALMAKELFLNYDQKEIIEKLQLEHDDFYIYLTMLGKQYRISRQDGTVEVKNRDVYSLDLGESIHFNIVMTIYDMLCYSKQTPVLAKEWCPLAMLQITSTPSADVFTKKYAEAFSGKTEELWNACETIGGRKPEIMAGADVCWEFDLFPFFPIQFRFWDKDEEFPPQIKLLWDKNSLDFMHFETLYYAMGILLDTLQKNIFLN